jgi:endonuclease G
MKKILFTLLLSISILNAWTWEQASQIAKELHSENFDIKNTIVEPKKLDNRTTSYYGKVSAIQRDRSYAKSYINNQLCDRVLKNTVVTTCYDDYLKSAVKVAYVIDGDTVYLNDIKKRPSWKYNKQIPSKYRSSNSDYPHTGMDKGHFAFDSAFDWDWNVLKNTYDLNINAIPMYAKVNRYTWIKSEAYAKKVAYNLGYVQVIDFAVFNNNFKTIGKNNIAVSKGFYKILRNKKENFEKCFYYENIENPDLKTDKLRNHEVDCNKVYMLMRH